MSDMAEVLGELWDQGNCTGLDGWVGPGRGAGEVDDVALDDRRRDVEKALAALTAAGYGLVAGAKREAPQYGPEFTRPQYVRAKQAEAWDEGCSWGSLYDYTFRNDNPYRKASNDRAAGMRQG